MELSDGVTDDVDLGLALDDFLSEISDDLSVVFDGFNIRFRSETHLAWLAEAGTFIFLFGAFGSALIAFSSQHHALILKSWASSVLGVFASFCSFFFGIVGVVTLLFTVGAA